MNDIELACRVGILPAKTYFCQDSGMNKLKTAVKKARYKLQTF